MSDVSGAGLFVRWIGRLVQSPAARRAFLEWSRSFEPDAWRRFAASLGRCEADEELVLDAALAAQRLLEQAILSHLDQATAVVEARYLLGLDSEPDPGA